MQRRVEELENALEHRSLLAEAGASGTQFTCFTGTKVQIMTPEELQAADALREADVLRKN